jgi:uncharacterized protein
VTARFLVGILLIPSLLATDTYIESVRAWQVHREKGLRDPAGWLTLCGLFWLKPGSHSIGSAQDSEFVLPKNSAPEHAGVIKLANDGRTVSFEPSKEMQGKARSGIVHYPTEEEADKTDAKPEVVTLGSASFTIIERSGRLAVRARDSNSPVLRNFEGSQFYPINEALHFHAKFVPEERSIPILNIVGRTEAQKSPGYVEFTYLGQTRKLRPIFEGKTLFFLYRDPTNKTETYQAGRMLNTPLPKDGFVDLDFNHSYNPPCTFTPYATCPLPPRENTLAFAVRAGEKRYGKGHPVLATQ